MAYAYRVVSMWIVGETQAHVHQCAQMTCRRVPTRAPLPSMELVLPSLNVVLQENLNLRVHLGPDVFEKAARNHGQPSKPNERERDGPDENLSACRR